MVTRPAVAALLAVSLAWVSGCAADGGEPDPLPSDLGDVVFETSCPDAARDDFNRAVALLHHMNYSTAREVFSSIAEEHPSCAMAHWGVAMTLFQPLWPTRPGADALERGRQAVMDAGRIGPATERERLFIAAAAAFFEPPAADYWQRIAAWATATARLAEAYPEDPEAQTFFALSQLALPTAGDSTRASAAALLLDLLQDQPRHPGAVHYTIHANDAAGREGQSLDVVRSYAAIAPHNPHALHMPTHIWVRLGQWPAVIEGNRDAAAAALASPAGDAQQWVWDEFPHAVEYLVYAHLQTGDDSAAFREMTRLQETANLQPTFKTAFNLSSIPARYMLERRDWAGAAQLEPRPSADFAWDPFAWPEAVTWFARGIGSARSGDLADARAAETRIAELRDASSGMGEELFAQQTEILRLGVAAWIAHADGDGAAAVGFLEQAVALESSTPKHPVTPAPTIPATEQLGELLLEMDRPAEALVSFQASLAATPNRFHSLVGAARAARRLGDDTLAARYFGELRAVAVGHSKRPELAEAIAYLER